MTSYLEYLAFAEIWIGEQRRKLLTSLDRPVVLRWQARPKHFGKPTVIPNGDLVVRSVKAVDQTLDCISIVVQDESASQISYSIENQVGKATNMIGFKSCRSKSANACTVSCSEPSPVIRTFLLYFPVSFMAWNVPTADPVAYPILP